MSDRDGSAELAHDGAGPAVPPGRSPNPLPIVLGIVAVVFGVLTVASGGRALFGDEAARAAVGAAVAFVLWFNFVAGFAYVAAGIGLWLRLRWSVWLAALLAAATLLVFAAFGAHILSGGAYEARTVGAMLLRSAVWLGIAVVAYRSLCRWEHRRAAVRKTRDAMSTKNA